MPPTTRKPLFQECCPPVFQNQEDASVHKWKDMLKILITVAWDSHITTIVFVVYYHAV